MHSFGKAARIRACAARAVVGKMAELLVRDAAWSEYDPDIEAAAAAVATPIAIDPVTGAFEDPTHERAFAAHFFRLCFGAHVVLMALCVSTVAWATPSKDPAVRLVAGDWCFTVSLSLIGRVRIHQWDDTVRAQRVGKRIWTALVVVSIAGDVVWLTASKAATCEAAASIYQGTYGGLVNAWTVLLNGTHGMGFAHKFGLVCALTLGFVMDLGVCGLVWTHIVALVGASFAAFGLAHLAEVHVRHNYADKQRLEVQINAETEESRRLEKRNQQLRAEKERLMYDVQRRGNPLDDDDARNAIRRGLQARPSPSYHRADSTDSRETGTSALSNAPLPTLPPGPPSSSAGKSSDSGKSGEGVGGSDREGMVDRAAFSRAPPQARPPTWEELDAQFYATRAQKTATEPRPPTWEKLDAQFYATRAQKTATEPRTASLASAEVDRHGPPPSSTVCRTSAAATPVAPLPTRPASRQGEIDELLDRSETGGAQIWPPHRRPSRRARGGRGVRNARRPGARWRRSRRARGRPARPRRLQGRPRS